MYSKEDILKHADILAQRINDLDVVKDYQSIEQQIHNNKTIESKMKSLKNQQKQYRELTKIAGKLIMPAFF